MSENGPSDPDRNGKGGPFLLGDVIGPALEAMHVPANGNDHTDEEDDRRSPKELLRAALDLVELGMRVFPVHTVLGGRCSCGDAACKDQGKHPKVTRWQDVASSDPATVTEWWSRWPTANIGLATGAASGVVVLDVDGPEGAASLATLEAKHGAIGATPRSQTPRPGLHILFEHPGFQVSNSTGKRGGIAPGLDVRGDGGYIVVPPSLHRNGGRYAWPTGMKLGAVELLPMPIWVAPRPEPERVRPPPHLQLVNDTRRSKYGRSALERECALMRDASEGSRNDQLNASAFALGQLVGGNVLSEDDVLGALLEAALAAGLPRRETFKTIDSGVSAGMKEPRGVPDQQPPPPANGHNDHAESSAQASNESETPNGPDDAPPTAQRSSGGITRLGVSDIFAPLPPSRWAVHELQIGPGRPGMIAGYGASAKTLAAQQLALAKASGTPIWGHFACEPGVVLHLDYEQGKHASIKRYQRLARGHGIAVEQLGQRLWLGVLPRVYLDDRNAADSFKAAFEGVDLVIIDALRGAAPQSDENDSSIRRTLDVLTYVSEYTGTTCIVLHHAGKPKGDGKGESDKRMLTRGSSAIFDACGCVLIFEAGKSGDGPKHISQQKQPAEAEGGKITPFDLLVEDVASDGNQNAGVRVNWTAPAPTDPGAKAAAAFDRDAERLVAVVRADSGIAANSLIERSGMGRTRAFKMLAALVDEGRLAVFEGGDGKTKRYRVTDVR